MATRFQHLLLDARARQAAVNDFTFVLGKRLVGTSSADWSEFHSAWSTTLTVDRAEPATAGTDPLAPIPVKGRFDYRLEAVSCAVLPL